ncbi:hypothetical protein EPUL_003564 [Erysiphe pulchra]|uniref:U4/U6.U5 small nuclear ribonucleoprotein 27kDa protein domain-containing protein n=1 Tax=Erysiphe pulchra TaxID=225359 RepID=A0A2S4PQN7_9PEZI|nr:hypothetical protein EPUL_003564 [Erysiphe pulchra]
MPLEIDTRAATESVSVIDDIEVALRMIADTIRATGEMIGMRGVGIETEDVTIEMREQDTGFQIELTGEDSGGGHRDSRGGQHIEKNSPSVRERDKKRNSRSRSPELEQLARNHRPRVSNAPEAANITDRISTPPVSFKVGPPQDNDSMDVDSDSSKKLKNDRSNKNKIAELQEEEEILVEEDGLSMMKAMMGFSNFGTTHQKKVPGNNVSAVRKEKKTEYRQYMNRVGGFNRPLSPSHPSR